MKAVLFRFAAISISLVIVASVGEVALRMFAPRLGLSIKERSLFCRFDHDLGWAPLENITRVDKNGFLFHQNQFGLRGPDDMQLKKTSGRKRVLVLGDSYVWGVGASQEDLFTAPAVHGTNDEFINGGVSGYGTDQEYLFYLRKGQKFDVDQVVLAFTPYNDVDQQSQFEAVHLSQALLHAQWRPIGPAQRSCSLQQSSQLLSYLGSGMPRLESCR